MMQRRSFFRVCVVVGFVCSMLTANHVRATDFTWDGSSDSDGDGFTWTDPLNWTADSGAPTTTADRAFFTGAANVTAGFPQNIHFLTTGAGLVQLNGTLGFGPNVSPQGASIGSGGLIMNGSMIAGGGTGLRDFSSSGNVTINGSLTMISSMPVQTAGTWDITTVILPQASGNIGAWNFVDGANTTITTNSIATQTYTFTGQPTFAGGRPNWNFINGGDGATGHNIQLGTFTLYGNTLTLDGWPGPPATRHTELNSNGGTLDLNALSIQGDTTASFLNLDNGTILIQGTSGTVWNNQSTANTQFDVATGTNTTINPTGTGSTVNVDTGSVNGGVGSFANNFAFNNLTLGGGDTVVLTGTAYTGGGNTALYVNGTLVAQNNATLNLNTRNAYVNGALTIGNSPGTFTVSNGDFHLTSNADVTFEINGNSPGTGYDQLVLSNGTLHLNGADLLLSLGTGWSSGLFFLVNNQGASAIDGTFNGLAQGAFISFAGQPDLVAQISYVGNVGTGSFLGGNDVVLLLALVPEPSTAMMGWLGLAVLGCARRRNRGTKA